MVVDRGVPVIRPAAPQDRAAVEALLRSSELPIAGVAEHLSEFFVAEHRGEIVASAGLEQFGSAALLRSVAVAPGYRNRGLARMLLDRLLDRARGGGIARVYLLTTTAADYFSRAGFAPVVRDAVDAGVMASSEFQGACCDNAQAMELVLTGRQVQRAPGATDA
jgi:amino-acid N-acetyltransferase